MSEKRRDPSGIISAIFAALNGLGLVAHTAWFLDARRQFLDLYQDLLGDAPLPMVTRVAISTPTAVVVLAALTLMAVLIAKEFIREKLIPLILNAVWMCVGIALLVLAALVLMLPLVRIMQSLE